MSNSQKDNDKTVGQQTGAAIDTSVSFLDNLWDRHATKIVLLVLLVCVLVWFRAEVTETATTVATTVSESVTGAVGAATEAVTGAAGTVTGAVTDLGAQLSAQVGPTELAGANAPTPAEIRALFDF